MHYDLLVIGDNVEEQLAPYDGEIEVAPYREEDDFSYELEEARALAAKCPADERPNLGDDVAVLCWYHGEDDVERNPAGGFFHVTTYNPVGKYDWYIVGGRWRGSVLRVKPTAVPEISEDGGSSDREPEIGYSDVCRKCDVDWEGMARDAAQAARHSWQAVHAVIDAYPPVTPWSEFHAHEQSEGIGSEEAQGQYDAQPAIIALGNTALRMGGEALETYLRSEDEYAQVATATAGVTMALVKDGQWYQGHWWIADRATRDDWNRRFHELLQDVPDDALLTIVDCHV